MSDGKKAVTEYEAPEADEAGPTFRQALVGYGAIFLAVVLLGVVIGIAMRVLR